MRTLSTVAAVAASGTIRRPLRLSEGNFGAILTDLATLLYPPPSTAAQIAAEIDCSVRNIELCLSGRQKWSGDAVALFVGEIMRRHRFRNFKVSPRD